MKFQFFYLMSYCGLTANYLWTFIKISGWDILLFLKTDNFTIKAFESWRNFLTVKYFNRCILATVSHKQSFPRVWRKSLGRISARTTTLSKRFFHIFIKAECLEAIILCKLYVVLFYLYIILTRVKIWWETILCCAVRWNKLHTAQRPDHGWRT